jgi:hypothetical protein
MVLLRRVRPANHEPVGARCQFTVTILDAILNLVLLQESRRTT